jgi:hypothetical protein
VPITIRPITRELKLTDYDESLVITGENGPKSIHVWVNPPRSMLDEREALRKRSLVAYKAMQAAGDDQEKLKAVALEMAEIGQVLEGWYARLWSQHPDPATHWTADDLRELAANDTDPQLYSWLIERSADMAREHRAFAKKKLTTPSWSTLSTERAPARSIPS